MTLKQFLKPDWRKIVIIIFIIISLLIPWVFMRTGPGTGMDIEHFTFFLFSWIFLPLFQPCGYISGSICSTIPFFVIHVIYWYFLSCLIIWIYDKVKKKK